VPDRIPPAQPPTRLFDWRVVCPEDVARRFPAIAGPGRGRTLVEVREERPQNGESAPPRDRAVS